MISIGITGGVGSGKSMVLDHIKENYNACVIKADELKELDTTMIAVPFGNGIKAPVQKYRDLFKLWKAMADDNAIYVLLGAELQSRIHYAMPVKDLVYDAIGYSEQVAKIGRENKKADKATRAEEKALENTSETLDSEGDLVVENGTLKIKLTDAEFLSGLKKGDKLTPIITAVVYFGSESWDAPTTLFEMLDVKDKRLLPFLNDYKLNLISSADINEPEFDKFRTDLGFAMRVMKHQSEDADEIIMKTGHKKIDADTANFLNSAIDLKLEIVEEEGGGVDMCKAMENRDRKMMVLGAIKLMRSDGAKDEDIVTKIVNSFHVTKEYVLSLLTPQKA